MQSHSRMSQPSSVRLKNVRNGSEADTPRLSELLISAGAEASLTGGESFTAKLHPEFAPYGEYDQLMRLDEWYGREA
jgi:ATP-dependent helicase/nuclease subunit B